MELKMYFHRFLYVKYIKRIASVLECLVTRFFTHQGLEFIRLIYLFEWTTIVGSTASNTSGFPAFPIPMMIPSLTPMSALEMPLWLLNYCTDINNRVVLH